MFDHLIIFHQQCVSSKTSLILTSFLIKQFFDHKCVRSNIVSDQTIYEREYNFQPKSRSCFVFCHFDAPGELKQTVQHYLNALSAIGDIIFVSNAPALSENSIALDFLNRVCMCVYVRDNDSYDFGCWAFGITRNLSQIRSQYEHLIFLYQLLLKMSD